MPSGRFLLRFAWAALGLLLAIAASACGGGDSGAEVTPTEAPTPFSLGSSFTIRGREVTLPEGVAYINETPGCQLEANASSDQCQNDLKLLVRGNSYILFDAATPRVIARRIEPEDDSDFRPMLNIIAGTAGEDAPDSSSSP